MSILVTTPALDKPSGVAAYYSILREHLPADVHFCTTGSRTDGETFLARGARLGRDYGRFSRLARRPHCRLVHLNPSLRSQALWRDGLALLIAKALGRKVLVFLHGWDPACEASIRRRFLFLFRRVYFRADAFVVLAARFQSVLRELGYHRPIYVETTAVADEVFRWVPSPPAPARREGAGVNILFLSRLEKSKGIYEALAAFRLLREKHPSATLTVAGDGSERENAEEYVQRKGLTGVRFLGWVAGEQKRQAFAAADAYLFPSWSEGMPISVLEAMACGLPVVTRPVGGLADFFEPGQMGYATDSRDPQVFATLLEKLVCAPDLRRQVAEYNHSFARRHFAASVAAGRLVEIYGTTIAGSPPPVPATGAGGIPVPLPAEPPEGTG